ncbi:MAG: D-alanine--D-alanine ligase [Endomicrobium sp.]|jgi:D-alanine-D-alanine ligase|nr:D-alanine--D-alanine ligase [Endomicrobium sp.]
MIDSKFLMKLCGRKVGVLYGGTSTEREISIESGKAVLSILNKLKLNVCGIDASNDVTEEIKKEKINIAYLTLHGNFGEDGTIQGMLEVLGIPYTGCGVLASSIFMNKDISKKLFKYMGVLTPDWITLRRIRYYESISEINSYPVVVKPVSQGSTIGVSIVKESSELADAVERAFNYDKDVIIEQFIEGKEITVGIINGKALPVVEIVPRGQFYDFESKYQKNGSKHIVPARIAKKSYKMAQNYAEKLYESLRCKGICRFDMIVDFNDKVWVLENNTVPGMTENSLIPYAGKAVGHSFEDLVLKILESAL